MTHTLHRFGTPANLQDDYVVFAMSAKRINEEGSAAKLRRFLEMALAYGPINAGDMKSGNLHTIGAQAILQGIQDTSIVHAVFTEEEKVAALLRDLRETGLGVSVIVSGLMEGVKRCAQASGNRCHTVEYSLGIWGQTDRLLGSRVLQITTMCGHGMVAAAQVERLAIEVRRERMTPEEAALELACSCVCGVFNQQRAARLIHALAQAEEKDQPPGPGQTMAALAPQSATRGINN